MIHVRLPVDITSNSWLTIVSKGFFFPEFSTLITLIKVSLLSRAPLKTRRKQSFVFILFSQENNLITNSTSQVL